MKKRIGKVLLVLVGGFLILLISGIMIKKVKAEKAAEKIRTLPVLVMKDIWGNSFSTDQITSGPLLITFFHPECDHCKYEISSLGKAELIDSQLTILLVSFAEVDDIQSFVQEVGNIEALNMHILYDPDFRMSDLYSADVLPSNFIYNKELELIKVFRGATRPEAIMKYLNEND
jgi:thiol-disulfide isomerase/thioredoxin